IPNDRARMQPHRKLLRAHSVRLFPQLADDPNIDGGLCPLFEDPDHRLIADLRIVDQQLLLRAIQKRGKLLPRIHRTDDELVARWLGRMAFHVGFEEPGGLPYHLAASRHKSETARPLEILTSEVKREQK